MKSGMRLWMVAGFAACLTASTVRGQAQANGEMERVSDGVIVNVPGGLLKLEVDGEGIIRVAYGRDKTFFNRPSLGAAVKKEVGAKWNIATMRGHVLLYTSKLQASLNTATGAVDFFDTDGQTLLIEKTGGRTMEDATVGGEATSHVRQVWVGNPGESLYGLGPNQLDLTDIKGYDIDLWQHNGTVAVPMIVSSAGYGILWDNPSYSKFGDVQAWEPLPVDKLVDAEGKSGGLTATLFSDTDFKNQIAQRVDSKFDVTLPERPARNSEAGDRYRSIRWEGQIQADAAGYYQFQGFSNGGIKFYVDGNLIFDHWRQNWLPWLDQGKLHFDAGSFHKIKLEWSRDQGTTMRLLWKPPAPVAVPAADVLKGTDVVLNTEPETSMWSEMGEGVDYYFLYGPSVDKVIAGYRQVTGQAPMIPIWALGLWQSRQRYNTQQESLDVVKGFRSRGIPFDNIVQDWFYWNADAWGSHEFDKQRFPDPDGWIKAIHDEHARLMISVWGKFYPGTDNFAAMNSKGYLYQRDLTEQVKDWTNHLYTFYDAFNPDARKLFWDQINVRLFSKGVDAWWMDASEPDLRPTPTLEGQHDYMDPTATTTESRVLNAWSLVNSQGIYEGQRAAAPDQRVFILTRSGYTGQQRYGAATWSGDSTSTWTAMRKQVSAGISYSISGLPWWTMDSGGFSVPGKFSARNAGDEAKAEWAELNTRWFEFATFVPLLRVHGEAPFREMWEFGGEKSDAYAAQLKFDRLRYALLPYLYSMAGDVTLKDGTPMRGLVMDFPKDKVSRELNDEYMFGPAFLVSPVTEKGLKARPVYLPVGTTWYDFWSGANIDGGQTVQAAPLDSIPLFVRGLDYSHGTSGAVHDGEEGGSDHIVCVWWDERGFFIV